MNTGNTHAIKEFSVDGSTLAGGIEGQIITIKSAIPDMQFQIEDNLAEGDQISVQVAIRATNTGPLVGMPAFGRFETPLPPTGKSVSVSGIYSFTIIDRKITSYFSEIDQIGLLRQLGWEFAPPTQSDPEYI